MLETITQISTMLESNPTLLMVVLAWTLAWKGVALWKSAKKTHLVWFIVLLVVNTVGILEILYIFVFSKMSLSSKKQAKPVKQVIKAKPKKKK